MAAMYEMAVPPPAQLYLDSTGINYQTVWEESIEIIEMYFMALNIRETKNGCIRVSLN